MLHTIAVFDLDRADFASFLKSMAMDLTVAAYPTYDDLLDYMEGSAAVIGTMMLPILGSSDPAAAREPARQLGFAFQLTNFIRDVAEDLDRGRTYLPDEDLAKFDVTRDDLLAAKAAGRASAEDPRADRVRGGPGPGPLPGRRAGHRRCSRPPRRPACAPRTRSTAGSSTRWPPRTTTSSRAAPAYPAEADGGGRSGAAHPGRHAGGGPRSGARAVAGGSVSYPPPLEVPGATGHGELLRANPDRR